MNESSAKAKQQVVEKIKSSTNILVTVSKNPAVDDLTAALGLSALLNKIDKHATAIFSGTIPPAITFLEPDKVFEDSADSLRDFIIALDKEKADHLRYKVEGDLVKIFITPYRANLTQDDLEFSQGDYNVELVLALGVAEQEDLDTALSAHQMLDDVTIMTLSAGSQSSNLGSVDWRDDMASSLSEMIASLDADLREADKTILDKQISTALLTGIVASTNRFSNENTSPKVMSLAAELMAAGADQQLISAKLQETHAINSLPTYSSKKGKKSDEKAEVKKESKPDDGSLNISHQEEEEVSAKVPTIDEILSQKSDGEEAAEPVVEEAKVETEEFESPVPVDTAPPIHDAAAAIKDDAEAPALGGTLNATTEQAAEDAKRALEDDQNKTILSHSYLSGAGASGHPINGVGTDSDAPLIDIFNGPSTPSSTEPNLPLPPPLPDDISTLNTTAPDPGTLTPPPMPEIATDTTQPTTEPTSTLPPKETSSDPGQFKIPNA